MVNKYKEFNQSQTELDFHNRGPMTHRQILDLADEFIEESLDEGYTLVSIITGTGIHSKNGPVIKPLIEDFLRSHPAVKSFQEGKFTQGGQGMLNVKLVK